MIIMPASNRRTHVARWAAALLLLGATACDTLSNPLEVEPASRIPSGLIETASNAQLLSDGAVGDFECAFNSYTAQAGTVGEEFIYAGPTLSRSPYERRAMTKDDADYGVNGCTGNTAGVYTPLQTARQSNQNVLAFLKTWTDAEVAAGPGSPNRTALMAVAAAYAGYATVLLGEGFCTMAISSVNTDKTLTYGGEIQRDSVFKYAIALFSEAITHATAAPASPNNTSIRTMAYLGRARARLNIGDYAGAKADAQQVPSGFLRVVTASEASARRNNRIFGQNSLNNRDLSVDEPYKSMGDARVPVVTTTFANSHTPPILHAYQTKYTSLSSPLPLATYEEAQLIIAEADIRAGSFATAVLILNNSRTRGGQPAYSGPLTQAALLAELIDQRRRELFAESHHLGDMIRYNITPLRPAGTQSSFGGLYGNQMCFPLPAVERLNNPLIGA